MGGRIGTKHSEATKTKIRAAQLGKKKSKEHSENIAKARTGTKRSPETVEKMRAYMLANPIKITPELREHRKQRMLGRNNPQFGKTPKFVGPRGKWTWYNGKALRSSYEERLAKVFDALDIKWLHEHKRFDLGSCTYMPDFYLPDMDEYWETKGWMDPRSIIRIARFRECHPDKKLIVINGPALSGIEQSLK